MHFMFSSFFLVLFPLWQTQEEKELLRPLFTSFRFYLSWSLNACLPPQALFWPMAIATAPPKEPACSAVFCTALPVALYQATRYPTGERRGVVVSACITSNCLVPRTGVEVLAVGAAGSLPTSVFMPPDLPLPTCVGLPRDQQPD